MNKYSIVEELNDGQKQELYDLYQQMWWSVGRTKEEISKILLNSLIFGIIEDESKKLIGFARVLTDEIKYAFIFDVMISEAYQGKGFGRILMKSILSHHKLQDIKNFELTCVPDLESFYSKFGFTLDYGKVNPMRYSRTSL